MSPATYNLEQSGHSQETWAHTFQHHLTSGSFPKSELHFTDLENDKKGTIHKGLFEGKARAEPSVYIINSFKYELELRIFPQVVIINNIIWEFSFDGCKSDDIFFHEDEVMGQTYLSPYISSYSSYMILWAVTKNFPTCQLLWGIDSVFNTKNNRLGSCGGMSPIDSGMGMFSLQFGVTAWGD